MVRFNNLNLFLEYTFIHHFFACQPISFNYLPVPMFLGVSALIAMSKPPWNASRFDLAFWGVINESFSLIFLGDTKEYFSDSAIGPLKHIWFTFGNARNFNFC